MVGQDSDGHDDCLFRVTHKKNSLTADVSVNDIWFQLDSGADVKTICRISDSRITERVDVVFVVVPDDLVCLLGLATPKYTNCQ